MSIDKMNALKIKKKKWKDSAIYNNATCKQFRFFLKMLSYPRQNGKKYKCEIASHLKINLDICLDLNE